MALEPSPPSDAFDLKSIRQLVKLMNENDLAEIDLRNGQQRVRLRKRGSELVPVVSVAPVVAAPAPPAAHAAVTSAPRPAPAAPAASNYTEIKSPMLGTFSRS